MPQIDMPLKALLEYKGRNPRPADFDAYWDSSLAEMATVDPKVELTRSAFQVPGAECFDLTFTGVGGAGDGAPGPRIYAKYIRPAGARTVPGVCQFHGYTGHSGDWADKLGFVAAGFALASLDCRGQGGKSHDTTPVEGTTHHGHIIRGLADADPKKLLFRSIFLDTARLAQILMTFPEIEPANVSAIGGSQGGALTLACAALEPRVVRAAPTYPFLCDYQRVWEMDLAKDAYGELKTFFRHFDPLHTREAEIFTRLGYVDLQHLAPRIKAEVLFGIGLMDTICPPSSQFAAYNKITGKKSYALYPDFGHEGLPGFSDRVLQFILGN